MRTVTIVAFHTVQDNHKREEMLDISISTLLLSSGCIPTSIVKVNEVKHFETRTHARVYAEVMMYNCLSKD